MLINNDGSGFLSSGNIVQMYFPNPFEDRCLNGASEMSLHVGILFWEQIPEDRNGKMPKNKTRKGGKLFRDELLSC